MTEDRARELAEAIIAAVQEELDSHKNPHGSSYKSDKERLILLLRDILVGSNLG